jgi:hypothetical protein
MPVTRIAFSCLATTFLFCQIANAQAAASSEKELMAKIAAVFEALGLNGKAPGRWVEVEYGPADSNIKLQGWLFRDEPDRIAIFEGSGRIAVLRIPGASETRPKSIGFEEAAFPRVAWRVRAGNLEQHCQKILEEGLPDLKKLTASVSGGVNISYLMHLGLEEALVSGCLLGYEANRRENAKLRRSLLAQAVEAFHRLPLQPLDCKRDLEECIVDNCAERMQQRAIGSANSGSPRSDLLLMWEILARLPSGSIADKAKDLVCGYKNLIEEDRRWQEPKWFGSLSIDQKIAYWMYRLRDLDDSMYTDMAMVSFGRSPRRILNGFLLPPPVQAKPNPARELAKLGKAALPEVIAHLDDRRPTRTGPLLRYGDCCQQIFEAITAHTIFEQPAWEAYPVDMGKEKQCKQRAEKWWAQHQKDEGS